MKRQNIIVIMLIILLMMSVTGCSDSSNAYNTEDGKGLFAKITIDNANILTTDTSFYNYYYLKDTKIVYAGYISKRGLSSSDWLVPVITENGNYCRYDTEKKQVIEIKENAYE